MLKIGHEHKLPNNTVVLVTHAELDCNNWGVRTGKIRYSGTVISSDSAQIIGTKQTVGYVDVDKQ